MTTATRSYKLKARSFIWLILVVLGLYVIVPQLGDFRSSWHLLVHPDYGFVGLAVLFIFITYLEAAATYVLLAPRPIGYYQEFIIQFATMFVNRLLPAGIGGIGANYQYLRHKRFKASEAASVVATNNLMGLVGHLLIVVVAILLASSHHLLPLTNIKHSLASDLKLAGIVILALMLIGLAISRKRLVKLVSAAIKQLVSYRHRPVKSLLALLTQLLLTISNVAGLEFSAKAVGVNLSFTIILLIFTFGSAVRNFTPTPGGIGGFEAGLVAAFAAYHVGSSQALAAVLLYRLISYWAPLLIGGLTFIYAERQGLLSH